MMKATEEAELANWTPLPTGKNRAVETVPIKVLSKFIVLTYHMTILMIKRAWGNAVFVLDTLLYE